MSLAASSRGLRRAAAALGVQQRGLMVSAGLSKDMPAPLGAAADVAANVAHRAAADVRGTLHEASAALRGSRGRGVTTGEEAADWAATYGEEALSEKSFQPHGEEVEHVGAVVEGLGESDEELVAAGGRRAAAARAAAAEPSSKEENEDEYPDSGEYVEGAEQVLSEHTGGDDYAERGEQSDHKFDDEYEQPWVPAPGGAASRKWTEWKRQADEAMQGGRVGRGIVLE